MKKLNLSLVILAASAAPVVAQGRAVPAGFEPPAGLCRVWIDGVPASRQPAPTNCVKAERSRPINARVIYGPTSLVTDRRVVIDDDDDSDRKLSKAEKERRKAIRKAEKERRKAARKAEKQRDRDHREFERERDDDDDRWERDDDDDDRKRHKRSGWERKLPSRSW